MIPRIETLIEKKLIGKKISMSLSDNKTGQLWKIFMPRLNEIQKQVSANLYSIQTALPDYFTNFNPNTIFEKWAAIEVENIDHIPDEMETITLNGGQYAVFNYKGLSTDTKIFEYIYGKWLPESKYDLDDKPHFCIMGEKYKNADPDSEEEIWIPIKNKE
jgi:AraC family transcriptional regulator